MTWRSDRLNRDTETLNFSVPRIHIESHLDLGSNLGFDQLVLAARIMKPDC